MKIILSRKGFDSTSGGVPSPILPDGRMVSLPMPDRHSPVRYGGIGGNGREIASLVSRLTRGRIRSNARAHLDPDVARRQLEVPEFRGVRLPGAGVFPRFSESLVLSDPHADRPGRWRLPPWMYPRFGTVPLTYHANRGRWCREADGVRLQAVARGQEFVLDTGDYPEAVEWVRSMLEHARVQEINDRIRSARCR